MNDYSYVAIDEAGESQSGEVSAENLASAVVQLEERGLIVQAINQVQATETAPETDVREFTAEAETALRKGKAWVPVMQAAASELSAGTTQSEVRRLAQTLETLETVDELLACRDLATLLPLLTSATGSDSNSQRLQDWLTRSVQEQQSRRIRIRSLAYPIALLILALLILVGLGVFLIPFYRAMFEDFGLTLPAPTLLVMYFSDLLVSGDWTLLIAALLIVAAASLAYRFWRRRALANRIFGRFAAGTSGNLRAMSNLVGTLAELLSLKAPLPYALQVAGGACGNAFYRIAANGLANANVEGGGSSRQARWAQRRFPPTVTLALGMEVEASKLATLRELATIYRERAAQRMEWFSSVFPLAAMLVLGLLVAFITIALLMPLVSMITSLA